MTQHFIDYLEAFADEMPDRDALVIRSQQGSAVRLTFRELDERLNRAVSVLAGLGVERGMHVGCHMYDTLAHVDVMLGAWKMGAVPINVNFRYVAHELAYLFDDARPMDGLDPTGQEQVHPLSGTDSDARRS